MKLRGILVALGAIMHVTVAGTVHADIGVVETTGAFFVNGAATDYISTIGTGNPRWAGYDFGTFDVTTGQTLALTNFYFENYAYNGGGVPPGGSYIDNWLDNSNTATFRLFRDGTEIYQNFMTQSAVLGNNRQWNLNPSGVNVNVLAGLTSGSHTLSYTIDWNYNQWTGSSVLVGNTQSTSAGNAVFTVLPEPSSLAALATGGAVAAGAWIRRRRAA